jgi:hypothetical protein
MAVSTLQVKRKAGLLAAKPDSFEVLRHTTFQRIEERLICSLVHEARIVVVGEAFGKGGPTIWIAIVVAIVHVD